MKPLLATLITLASLLLAAPAAAECDENGCRNRPEATAEAEAKPRTRAMRCGPPDTPITAVEFPVHS